MASAAGAATEPQAELRKTQESTEPTQEPTGKSPETKGDLVEADDKLVEAAKQREEVLQDYQQLFRKRFDTVSSDNSKHRGDVALPRNFDDFACQELH